jgi:hypothetical protein
MNVVNMNDQEPARRGISTLSLQFDVIDGRPDWPVVRVLIDGCDPFSAVAPGWRGFDPEKMLGKHSPLLPSDHGRRVAVYCCSCGEPGCGVIAPVIVPSPDGRCVSWVDFRDYTGVFIDPVVEDRKGDEGRPWNLADLHFDRTQYVEEIERAARDGSWETDRRRTARLLYERLKPMNLVLPPDLVLAWVSPAWTDEGVTLMFERIEDDPEIGVQQRMLRLTSALMDPDTAAEDMAGQLLSIEAAEWAKSFGYWINPDGSQGRASLH